VITDFFSVAMARVLRGWVTMTTRLRLRNSSIVSLVTLALAVLFAGCADAGKTPEGNVETSPFIVRVAQSPATPRPGEPVRFEIRVRGLDQLAWATLFYRLEGGDRERTVSLRRGESSLGEEREGVLFSGVITPPHRAAIVEFRIEAGGRREGSVGAFPRGPLRRYALFDVREPALKTPLPLYRVIMREADLRALRERSPFSDELLPASLVEGERIHYDVGVRLRGSSTRQAAYKDYRIEFSRDERLDGPRKRNIHCNEAARELIGRLAFEAMGIPSLGGSPVSLMIGEELFPRCLDGERVSRRFLKRRFGDAGGDVYRGTSQPLPADRTEDPRESLRRFRAMGEAWHPATADGATPMLDGRFEYWGDPSAYRFAYLPVVGGGAEELSRIAEMSEVFERASDGELVRSLARYIDVDEWVRYFAARQALGDGEAGLHSRQGVDYFLYRSPADGKRRLLPWDLDQVLNVPDIPLHDHLVRAVMRLLRNEEIAPRYAAAVARMLEKSCPPAVMDGIIDRAKPLLRPGEGDRLRQSFARIAESNLAQIPRALSVRAAREVESAVPLGDEIWAPKCLGWEDALHVLPRCPEKKAKRGEGALLGMRFEQRFSVPCRAAVASARFSSRGDPGVVKRAVPVGAGVSAGATCEISIGVNGTTVIDVEIPIEEILAGRSFPDTAIPLGVLGSDNTAVIEVACPAPLVRRFSTQMLRRSSLPAVRLDVVWNAAKSGGVLLSGRADATRTRAVRIDGVNVSYVPWKAEWMALREAKRPVDCAVIEALDEHGAVFETLLLGLADGRNKSAARLCPEGSANPDLWIDY